MVNLVKQSYRLSLLKPVPRTKHEVDQMMCCSDMATWIFHTWIGDLISEIRQTLDTPSDFVCCWMVLSVALGRQ